MDFLSKKRKNLGFDGEVGRGDMFRLNETPRVAGLFATNFENFEVAWV
jgi:hypothetical protein